MKGRSTAVVFRVFEIVLVSWLAAQLPASADARRDGLWIMRPRVKKTEILCQFLPVMECAFAVDTFGRRCMVETLPGTGDWHVCQTSNILVGEGSPVQYVETEQCIQACGVDRMTVGFSTDTLGSEEFQDKLCSSDCINSCPNLVDLYTNLIAEEGSTFDDLCHDHSRRRVTLEDKKHHLASYSESDVYAAVEEKVMVESENFESKARTELVEKELAPAPAPGADT